MNVSKHFVKLKMVVNLKAVLRTSQARGSNPAAAAALSPLETDSLEGSSRDSDDLYRGDDRQGAT